MRVIKDIGLILLVPLVWMLAFALWEHVAADQYFASSYVMSINLCGETQSFGSASEASPC